VAWLRIYIHFPKATTNVKDVLLNLYRKSTYDGGAYIPLTRNDNETYFNLYFDMPSAKGMLYGAQ